MTKKLEELFDLPRDVDQESEINDVDDQVVSEAAQLPVLPETLANLDKIEVSVVRQAECSR